MSKQAKEQETPQPAAAPDELQSLKGQLLRLQADFENAKKRWLKNQADAQESAAAEVIRPFLEIMDDFERALAAPGGKGESFRAGMEMIGRRIADLLESFGVRPIETVGRQFDPNCHEAVAHEETDQAPENTVLKELRRGYRMNHRVLRPAAVQIASAPAESKTSNEATEEGGE